MKIKNIFPVLLLSLLPSFVFAGTAHYVDCNAGKNGNGSYASPWNNIPSVNSHKFNSGDDVYFKVNTTCTLKSDSDRLQVDWGGTSGDRAIIGAYYGNGQFGLNGNSRPIIDGDNQSYPSTYKGLVEANSGSLSHITIQYLKLQYSGAIGITVNSADNVNVDNCIIWRTYQNGIIYGKYGGDGVNTGVISNNFVSEANYPEPNKRGGAAIEVTGGNREGSTTNITVEYNKVTKSSHEGIGFYKKITYCTMQYNVVYDIESHHLYIDSGKYNIIRYNLVYTLDPGEKSFNRVSGIVVSQEEQRPYNFGGYNQIYGNLVAAQSNGISLGCKLSECDCTAGQPAGCAKDYDDPACVDYSGINCHDDTLIYNNTLVDNTTNFRNWQPKAADDVEFKNNISWTITAGTRHSNNYNPAGVTWSHNYFDDAVTGKAATNAVMGNPALKKSSGWRSLTADSLDGAEFSLLSGSKAVNAGKSIVSYNYRITASDYLADPIMMMTSIDSKPDIGAWTDGASQKMITLKAPSGFRKMVIIID